MLSIYRKLALASLAVLPIMGQSAWGLTEEEARDYTVDTYIYGYPLVTMDMTRQVMTNVAKPVDNHAPMGQFANIRKYPDASFRDVTAPNADTLYSSAWLDLSKEPYILHVPDVGDRYYLFPILDGWTNVFADIGTRTTGTKAGDYAITGPNWQGTLPAGIKEFKSPTNIVWILGRTYSTGTPEDYKVVHALQDQYRLTPLSYWGKSYTPPVGQVDPNVNTKIAVREQVNALSGEEYFKRFYKLLKNNPPTAEDSAIIKKMAQIGIVPYKEFNINNVDPIVAKAIKMAPKIALEKIAAQEKTAGKIENGWTVTTKTGSYGTDYIQRAFVTAIGLGANLPQDAIYPTTLVDSSGERLSGKNRYVIHFDKGQVPPVNGFWSLTMYNDQYFFVNNPLNRYTLSPRDPLKYNDDGSLDLYIQNVSPGEDKEANWLPAPAGNFGLMFRFYWPKEAIIDGSWIVPGVKKV